MTGEGRRVRESVATPGTWTGGGGREGGVGEEDEGGEGEVGFAAGGGIAGERTSCPEWVRERLRPCPASSTLTPPPPPPPMAAVVAITITAF